MGLLRSVFETSFDFLFQNKKLKKKNIMRRRKRDVSGLEPCMLVISI